MNPKKINIPDLDLANPNVDTGDNFRKNTWKQVTGGYEYVEELSKFNIWSLQVIREGASGTAIVTIEQSNFSPFGDMFNRIGKSFDQFTPLKNQNEEDFLLSAPGYIQSDDIFRAKYIKIKVATTDTAGVLLFEFDQK